MTNAKISEKKKSISLKAAVTAHTPLIKVRVVETVVLENGHFQARKRHININFFVWLVPVFTGLGFTGLGFVPGTNPVKNRDKPRNSPYSTQWKPDFTEFVPGTNPGTKGGTESLCAFFAR